MELLQAGANVPISLAYIKIGLKTNLMPGIKFVHYVFTIRVFGT